MRGWGWLVLALVAGCGRAGAPPAPPAPPTIKFEETPYYPLKIGAAWTYRGDKHTLVSRVMRREQLGGIDCAVVETERDKKPMATEHWLSTAEGLYWVGLERRRLSPPLRMLRLPPRAGDTWQTNLRDGREKERVQQAVLVVGEEEVTVPAGTYRAVTLQGEITQDGVRQRAMTYWFAPGVGIVKMVIRQGEQRQVYELEKYEPGK